MISFVFEYACTFEQTRKSHSRESKLFAGILYFMSTVLLKELSSLRIIIRMDAKFGINMQGSKMLNLRHTRAI